MAKRRPSGDGMVRKREDGRWEGRIVVGHKKSGDSIFRYISAPTQKELSAKLRQLTEAYKGVDLTEESNMALSVWLDKWLDEYMAAALRPTTLNGYRRSLELHVKPYLGNKTLSKITAVDLRSLYRSLQETGRVHSRDGQSPGLSARTVHGIHTTLHHALKTAMEQNLIPNNPAAEVDPPKFDGAPMKILTEAQLDAFMKVIEKDEFWHDFFYTAVTTGLRRGEICALRWEDFDAKQETLHVRRTLHKEKGKPLITGDTKTYAGTRKIVLPPSTAQLLRERKKTAPTEWIFPNPFDPEQPIAPGTAYNRLKALLKETGLPDIRFHDLRHTFATHALSSGVDAKTLAGILGHTKASFTLDTYTHTTGDIQQFYTGLKQNGRLLRQEQYGEGLSGQTVRGIHTTFHAALDKAVSEKIIPKNPSDFCRLPSAKAREMQVLSPEEIQRLLIQAKEDGCFELLLLELSTGLRRGEICALQWDDLNFNTGELQVKRQVHRVKGELVVSEPKTKASNRSVILPPPVLMVLSDYKTEINSVWLFPSPLNNDSPRDPAAVRKRLTTILERADCKRVRFHDLRHTFATASLEHGMDIKTLSTIIGHVSTATTLNVYAHVTDEMRKIAAAKIDRGIAKSESLQDIDTAPRKPAPSTFLPHKGQRRKPGTGCVSQINEKLWEGRYSPKLPNGARLARNVYAHSEKECEQKLAELIVQTKAEIAAQLQQPQAPA